MSDTNKSSDLLWVFKDIWKTGTQELNKNMWNLLAATPPKEQQKTNTAAWSLANSLSAALPSWSGNQISHNQEQREKSIIERRKIIE